jgi:hypothetical protein
MTLTLPYDVQNSTKSLFLRNTLLCNIKKMYPTIGGMATLSKYRKEFLARPKYLPVEDQVKLVLLLNSILLEWFEMVVWMVFVVHKNTCTPSISLYRSVVQRSCSMESGLKPKKQDQFCQSSQQKTQVSVVRKHR